MKQPIYERLRQQIYEYEIRAEARNKGRNEAHSEMLNAIVDLMRSNIISPEQFEAIKAATLNTQQIKQ